MVLLKKKKKKTELLSFLPLNSTLSSLSRFTKTRVAQVRSLGVFLDSFSSFTLRI